MQTVPTWWRDPKALADVYLPCALHPTAPIRRSIAVNASADRRARTVYRAVCGDCGRPLEKKPA
jgi:hypothetical protein